MTKQNKLIFHLFNILLCQQNNVILIYMPNYPDNSIIELKIIKGSWNQMEFSIYINKSSSMRYAYGRFLKLSMF